MRAMSTQNSCWKSAGCFQQPPKGCQGPKDLGFRGSYPSFAEVALHQKDVDPELAEYDRLGALSTGQRLVASHLRVTHMSQQHRGIPLTSVSRADDWYFPLNAAESL